MDIILLILSFLLILLGIAGSFLPVIPGPITGWFGFLLFHLTKAADLSTTFLVVTFAVSVAVLILDYVIPAVGTKRFGGTKYGVWGTTIGLLVGLFFPPFGIVIGPFLGAFVGELLSKNNQKNALRAAFGSFLGFIASTFMKFFVSLVFLGLFLWKTIQHWDAFF